MPDLSPWFFAIVLGIALVVVLGIYILYSLIRSAVKAGTLAALEERDQRLSHRAE